MDRFKLFLLVCKQTSSQNLFLFWILVQKSQTTEQVACQYATWILLLTFRNMWCLFDIRDRNLHSNDSMWWVSFQLSSLLLLWAKYSLLMNSFFNDSVHCTFPHVNKSTHSWGLIILNNLAVLICKQIWTAFILQYWKRYYY